MRYLSDDLPADIYARIAELALPGSLEGVRTRRADAEQLFNATLRSIDGVGA